MSFENREESLSDLEDGTSQKETLEQPGLATHSNLSMCDVPPKQLSVQGLAEFDSQ